MVKFFRSVLLHLFAIVVAFGLFCVLGLLVLSGLSVLMQPQPAEMPSRAVLVVDLGMEIYDSPGNTNPLDQALAELQGEDSPRVPLRQILSALEEAKSDDRIAGVLLAGTFERGGSMANTIASITELRAKLEEVRDAGKTIYAYSHTEGMAELYLKSVANQHWMDPFGMFDYRGMAAQIAYLGGAFERFGIEYQVVRAGVYKSAGEPFVQREMSPEMRESLSELLGDLWLSLREAVAEETALDVEALDELASETPLITPARALDLELVDGVIRYDEMLEELIGVSGFAAEGRTFNQIALADYIALQRGPAPVLRALADNQVVVVYAEGTIVDGEGSPEVVGGDRYARLFRRLRQDDDVRAVVLRVNSPGGSATASEAIAREVELTNAKKPVVVSMGGYAASGGYYIAAPGDIIFAQPTTVTGSIGVAMMIPNVEELASNFEVNFETVETNRYGTLWSVFDSREEGEMALFQDLVEQTYQSFLQRVADGRELPVDEVDRIAQGREWSGVDARQLGLIDRFGGLEDAIAYAADLAGLGDDYTVVDLPPAQTLEEVIAEAFGGGGRGPLAAELGPSLDAIEQRAPVLLEQWQFLRHLSDRYHLYSYAPARVGW